MYSRVQNKRNPTFINFKKKSNDQETEIEKTNKNYACKIFQKWEGITFIPTPMSTLDCSVLKVRSLMYSIILKELRRSYIF